MPDSVRFPISEGELVTALQQGSRYYVYRVLRAHTAAPRIVAFQDPARLLLEHHATLVLHGAKLSFAVHDEPREVPPVVL